MEPPVSHRTKIDAKHWHRRLATLAKRYHVPGAQLGILRVTANEPDELVVVTDGVLSLRTQAPTTEDSLFQIGSITKVWTATVIMQLVDEGRLALDTPVAEVLPDLRLSDADVTRRVTIRHLLTHTSGIDGDVFTDTGRGDDCLERYVALLADVAQNHPLGVTWSYCNAGYSLLGRVIEHVTGTTWDRALRDRLFTPLGLSYTVTLPEEALLFGTAVGHVEDEGAPKGKGNGKRKRKMAQKVAPVWTLPRSLGPAGLITARAADVLAFARMHLSGGRAANGTQILSEASAAAMTDHQADLPEKYLLGDSWGLGWIRFGWVGRRLIGHDGNTIGQAAFLRLLPEQGLAVTLLTNGGQTRDLYDELFREIFETLAGVHMPHPLTAPDEPVEVDASPFVGTYERASVRLDVLPADTDHQRARLRTTVTGTLAELEPEEPKEYEMVPAGPELFVVRPPESEMWFPVVFYSLATGERYLHFGARATPLVTAPASPRSQRAHRTRQRAPAPA
jgi:CubicO group peptidase (beta-lactamase class C family)